MGNKKQRYLPLPKPPKILPSGPKTAGSTKLNRLILITHLTNFYQIVPNKLNTAGPPTPATFQFPPILSLLYYIILMIMHKHKNKCLNLRSNFRF